LSFESLFFNISRSPSCPSKASLQISQGSGFTGFQPLKIPLKRRAVCTAVRKSVLGYRRKGNSEAHSGGDGSTLLDIRLKTTVLTDDVVDVRLGARREILTNLSVVHLRVKPVPV
jgi:hypothetical protein